MDVKSEEIINFVIKVCRVFLSAIVLIEYMKHL